MFAASPGQPLPLRQLDRNHVGIADYLHEQPVTCLLGRVYLVAGLLEPVRPQRGTAARGAREYLAGTEKRGLGGALYKRAGVGSRWAAARSHSW